MRIIYYIEDAHRNMNKIIILCTHCILFSFSKAEDPASNVTIVDLQNFFQQRKLL